MSYPAPRSVHNSSTAKALVDTHTLQLEYKPHVKKKKKKVRDREETLQSGCMEKPFMDMCG